MIDKITIRVGPRAIKAGERHDPYACPIALAVRQATNDALVHVGNTTVSVYLDEFTIPPGAQKWRKDFDAGRLVPPITFTLKRIPNDPDRVLQPAG